LRIVSLIGIAGGDSPSERRVVWKSWGHMGAASMKRREEKK
jgi:hypothetical protein